MTGFLFFNWLDHFVKLVDDKYGISPTNRNLLIVDRHNSHITIDVVRKARDVGVDMLTLHFHTSHALQPLDVAVFKPFKTVFRAIRDQSSFQNIGYLVRKEDLATWVSQVLKRAMTKKNICAGFKATGIWPLNKRKMDAKLGPSQVYRHDDHVNEAVDEHIFPYHFCHLL
jgi:hypothetical protein